MSDVNANIGVQIDTSAALAELKALQRQLAQFHAQISKTSATAAAAQKNLQTNLLNAINATGKFRAEMGVVRTSTESFTHALEKNKFSMREYFRYAGGATKTFGSLFKSEFDTIGKVAEERVKRMQTQYIKMGRDASGAMKAMAITPTTLDMKDHGTQLALTAQKQALFNQLVKQGSTSLLNFGKNTQWAGRQLMVGFTIPLMYFGSTAAKTFMDLEAQAIKFKRVYGDMFTTTDQTNKALQDIQNIAKEFTKYGVAVKDTMEMAAQAAAMGKTGAELQAQVTQASKLAVLGGVDQQQALETTISLTNAFGISADELTKKINFLNAVENQTVTSIEDLTIAVPKAGPVIQQLGGSVEDLAFFLTAMREGGINASESANALKSGLASLINPTKKASEMLQGYGINVKAIVEGNAGNLKETVIDFAQALDTLAPLQRAKAIEQMFGKFQFARLSTLFQNITKDGTQANRVLGLAGKSVEELAILSEREMKTVEDAVGTNFKAAVEQLKLAIAPIGKTFLQTVTPLLKSLGSLLDKFNNLGDGTKKFVVVATTLVGLIGPTLIMTFGLLANGAANIIKLFLAMRTGFLKLTGNTTSLAQQTQYMTTEQLEAATVAASLNQAHNKLTQSFTVEAEAVRLLRNAYIEATVAGAKFSKLNPGMMGGFKGGGTKKFADGTTGVTGGVKGKDSVLSLLTPGEAVVPADIAQDDRFKPLIEGLVSGKIAKYNDGTTGVSFGDREFNARSAKGAQSIREFLKSLSYDPASNTYTYIDPTDAKRSGTFSRERLLQVFQQREADGKLSLDKIKRSLNIGSGMRGSGVGSSAPTSVKKLTQQSQSSFRAETKAVKEILKRKGITLTPAQEKNLFTLQASHLTEERGATGEKVWRASNLVADQGYINNYINTVKGKLGKNLLAMSDAQLGSLGIDRNELKGLAAGNHPRTANAAETLRGIARYDASLNPRSYQAQAVLAGLEYRSKTGFYNKPLKTLADLPKIIKKGKATPTMAVGKGEVIVTKDGKVATVTGQTGRAKPSGMRVIGGGLSDKRIIGGSNIAKIFPAGLKGPRLAGLGAEDGFPGETKASKYAGIKGGGTASSQYWQRASKANATAIEENTNTTKQVTAQQKTLGSKIVGAGNAATGLAIVGSFLGGKIGELSQKILPVLILFSTLAQIGPALKSGFIKMAGFLAANPFVAIALVIASMVVAYKVLDAKTKQQAAAQSRYIEALSATTEKMKAIGEITGKVGASEVMARRRQGQTADKFTTGYDRAGQQFGTSFLESKVGKDILSSFQTNLEKGGSEAVKTIALELSSYISDGIMTAEDANSVARSIGINLSNMAISSNIQGELRSIIGPNGEKLESEPLKVRLQIVQANAGNQQEYFKALQEQFGLASGDSKLQQELSASSAASGAQTLETIQAQRDAQAKLYDDQIRALEAQRAATSDKAKQLKIDNQIKDLRGKAKKDDAALAKEREKSLKTLLATYETIAKDNKLTADTSKEEKALFASAQEQVKLKYKDDPFTKTVISSLSALKGKGSEQLELTLLANMGSGDMTPLQVTNLLKLYDSDVEAVTKVLNTDIAMKNPDKFAQLQNLVGGLTGKNAKAVGLDIMTKLTAPGGEDKFDDRLAALTLLQKMDNKEINVAAFLKGDILGKLDSIVPMLNEVEKIKGKITKTVVLNLSQNPELKALGPNAFAALAADWEHYVNLDPETQKTAIETFITVRKTITDDNVGDMAKAEAEKRGLRGRSAAAFIAANKDPDVLAAKLTKAQFAEGKAKNTIPGGGTTPDGGGTGRDTTLDELLKRLKFVRDAAINAEGGVKELLRATSGKGIEKFGGVIQQLMAGPKGGFNREFISFLEQMDNKTRAIYMTEKDGKVILTEKGKALKEAFNEKVIGEYQVAQVQSIQDTLAQRAALLRLTAAGVDTGTALEMVADANLAVAINSKDISSDELKNMADNAKRAKDEIADLNLEIQNLNQGVKDKLKNLDSTANALAVARKSGITDSDLLRYIASNQSLADQITRKGINDPQVQELLKNQPKIADLEGSIDGLVDPLQKIQDDFNKARDKAEAFYSFLENQANDAYKQWLKDTKVTFDGVSYSIEEALQKAEDKIAEYQEQINDKQRDIEINYDRPIEKLQGEIDKIQRGIELQFDRPIEQLQKEIDGLQRSIEINFDRPIQALQDESGRLSNDLTLMDRAAQAINERYDAQEQALNKISEINQDIIAQEKQRISLADALSQGDISAAAQAAQDLRAAQAASAAQRAGGTLQAARDAEIANLRSASGMTRDQIEARQFQIGQQTFALEQQRAVIQAQILVKQDAIYNLEQAKAPLLEQIRSKEDEIYRLQGLKEAELIKIRDLEDKIYKITEDTVEPIQAQLTKRERQLKAELDAIEAQRVKWDAAQKAIDTAKLKADGFDTTMKGIEDKTKNMLKNWQDIQSKVVELTIKETRVVNTVYTGSGASGTGKGAGAGEGQVPKGATTATALMYGGKVKPMAFGGRVGSDSVPALLTPGEFVVNKAAAKAFGPLLGAINDSKYPSMIARKAMSASNLYSPIMQDSFISPSYSISSPTINNSIPINNTIIPVNNNSSSVYNYSIDIAVGGSNINADTIAKSVVNEIRYIDSQRIKTQRAG